MNFMSYVAEVSRGWDEPNARDMERMTSQPNAKGEMYILNDDIDMRAKFASMERRLEKLEMTNMQPVQAISQTPLQAMPCAICLSYEHLVDECPTIPAEREMFALPQASSLEQAMVNLSKFVGDFVGGIHEVEAQQGESSMVKEVKTVITLSGKEVDLPTCKLEHKVESETEKEKREGIKGKKKGKSIEKDDYIDEEPQRIVIKEELMKKHMPPPFLQALYGKIIQRKPQVRDANFIWDPGKLNQEQIF
ncbi:hypothetical protein CK203_063667 [Vitis vinifera]|uniref:Uncharacterized protein n=1 Tax=Vitis vinifera TaxID=29760 RepID=A0A438G810_VITVI|nr:hypothetical protein CK203_063667 [Vitis vinifera]